MNGFIKISVEEVGEAHNFKVQAELRNVGIAEKAALLDAFLDGIEVRTDTELAAVLMMRDKLETTKREVE